MDDDWAGQGTRTALSKTYYKPAISCTVTGSVDATSRQPISPAEFVLVISCTLHVQGMVG